MTPATAATKSVFAFDPKAHAYTLDGQKLPSVTGILKDAGFIDGAHFTEQSRQRGTIVHAVCAGLDRGFKVHWDTLHPDLHGYVKAYEKFRADCPQEWTAIEKPGYHSNYLFAGTPDRVREGERPAILDIKTGGPEAWHGFQLAAYSILCFPPVVYPVRQGLHLRADGTYKLETYKDHNDRAVFLAALTVYNAKRR